MSDPSGIKRLYKSRTERMIDGVCGGVAKYFNLDPTLVRIAWVILTLLGGSGIILYIVAMIVMPKEPYVFSGFSTPESQASASEPSQKNSFFWGILLICVGMFLFLDNVGFSLWHHWWSFDWDFGLSVLLILVGVAFLWGGRNSMTQSSVEPPSATGTEGQTSVPPVRILRRSFNDKKIFGVCGGIAEYFGIDSSIVRILSIVGAFVTSGVVIIAYIGMAIAMPKENPTLKTA